MLLLLLLLGVASATYEDATFWRGASARRLTERLANLDRNPGGRARNVILFIGDGMGLATVTATGIFRQGEGHLLSWEHFPVVGLAKTYSADRQVPDSAATATAFLSGVKTRNKMLGLDATASMGVCTQSNNASMLSTLARWAQEGGRHAGVVTTARVTHATPAALYARINHRDWECDGEIPETDRYCVKDIAMQLVEELPGRELRVVLGGGLRQFGAEHDYNSTDDSCFRQDRRNLTKEWTTLGGKRTFVKNTYQLMNVDLARTDYLMGLFSPGHLPYDSERNLSQEGQPSLTNMTVQAIRMLQKHKSGYFLLVEGARIDMAHHKNYARIALQEAAEMDNAVAAALQLTQNTDTLVVVTADHSHAMTMNGYPDRGNDILGLARFDDTDNTTYYETLSYANGPAAKYHANVNGSGWKDPRSINASERAKGRYQHFAPIYLKDETHAGEDVPVYATGPGSELLGGVYEQNYIAHAIAYAAGFNDTNSGSWLAEGVRWWIISVGVITAFLTTR